VVGGYDPWYFHGASGAPNSFSYNEGIYGTDGMGISLTSGPEYYKAHPTDPENNPNGVAANWAFE
jgi:hypothetical protein